MRNKPHKIFKFILGAIFCLSLSTIFIHPTHAADYKKVATYKLTHGYYTQGAAMTREYYIYSDWNKSGSSSYKRNGANVYKGGSTQIVFCKRKSNGDPGKDCKRTGTKYIDHVNYMYHVWGTDYFATETQGSYMCWSISGVLKNLNKKDGGKVNKSNCGNVVSSGNFQGYGSAKQGHTEYISPTGKKYYLRAFATYCGSSYCDHIVLYNDKYKKIAHYDWDKHYEVEDVMVDNDTGAVYFNTNEGGSTSVYKLNDDIFGKWLKPGGGGAATENRTAEKSVVDKDPKVDEYHYTSQYQYDGTVDTLFFGTLKEDGEGCGVYTVLDLVITILTMGIGIAAAIGISISGIMYLTAKGNVARATKAKRRIYEIVIGLIAYAALFAILTFILPEFNPEFKACTVLTEEEVAARDAARKEASEAAAKAAAEARAKESGNITKNEASKSNNGSKTNTEIREELARVAKELAQSKTKYLAAFESSGTKAWEKARCNAGSCNAARLKGQSCSSFVATVVRTVIPSENKKYSKGFPTVAYPTIYNYVSNTKNNWKQISKNQAGPGDIEIQHGPKGQDDSHVSIIYAKTKDGQLKVAEASNGQSWPHLTSGNKNYHPGLSGWPKYYRYVGG